MLRQAFFWSKLTADVRSFVSACIQCLSTTGGEKVPRPFGPVLHGTSPNDLLQIDCIELGPSSQGVRYVLMIRDYYSSYRWIFPFYSTSEENAAHAIIDWRAAIGTPRGLTSDGPTHFCNETLRLVARSIRTPQDITVPYCPWSNGSIERLGQELLHISRALLSELQMQPTSWPDLLPLFQNALNNSPSPASQNIAPITAFTGLKPSPPITTFMRTDTGKPMTVDAALCERLLLHG